jgi:hypothetical protein
VDTPSQKITVADGGKRPEPQGDRYLGKLLGDRYRILEKLGEGGMGAVYLAEHVHIEKKFAVKVLTTARSHDYLARFAQEAKSASKIGHENIIDITDFGDTDDGAVFLAMEHLKGRDLGRTLRSGGPLDLRRCVTVLNQVCSALQAAHQKGIVHRDLKPDNIFLVERRGQPDFVKVLDFGLARLTDVPAGQRITKEGTLLGTPEYMSPEQVRGDAVDGRTDVYAAGCVLFEMLTGEVPFSGEPYVKVLSKHLKEPPRLPSQVRPEAGIPPALDAVVQKALAKDLETRFASMKDLALALCAATNHDPRPWWGGSERIPVTVVAPSARRRWPWVAAAVAVVIGGLVLASSLRAPKPLPAIELPKVEAPKVETPKPAAPLVPAADTVLTIHSTPEGAQVKKGSQLLGETPLELKLPANTAPLAVVLSRRGYRDAALELQPDHSRDYQVRLLELPRTRKATPAAPKSGELKDVFSDE